MYKLFILLGLFLIKHGKNLEEQNKKKNFKIEYNELIIEKIKNGDIRPYTYAIRDSKDASFILVNPISLN